MNQTDRSVRAIFLFWVPLAAQWLMMGLETPFLAAVIARLLDPTFNLAAYGVAYAIAILVESPVIMLMSAATALVDGPESYRRLRNFANALNALSTALLLIVLVPPVHDALMVGLLGLPREVADLVYGALWILLPWPAAIGYRRFLHGVLIRSGRTRLVAYGTFVRLLAMAGTGIGLATAGVTGAWVGAAALSAGVVVEAVAARVMAAPIIRTLLATPQIGVHTPPRAAHAPSSVPGYAEIARFYYPLALTSLIGLTVQPLLTFFMGRAPLPVESLAVFPVVHALSFLFRTVGLSFQEAAIALLGPTCEHVRALARFGLGLGIATSALLGAIAFTPLADVWFRTISGLPPHLADLAVVPTRVIFILPALSVLLSLQRAVLVQTRHTAPITVATALEVATIAALFPLFAWGFGLIGVTAAMCAFVAGRLAGVGYLSAPARRAMATPPRGPDSATG